MSRTFFVGAIGGVLGALLTVGAVALANTYLLTPDSPERAAQRAQTAIMDFQCARDETRRVELRGVPNGFTTHEVEPSGGLHPRLDNESRYDFVRSATAGYNNSLPNRNLLEHFDIPSNTSSARLFLRFDQNTPGAENDSLWIGDMSDINEMQGLSHTLTLPLREIDQTPGWHKKHDIYFADLGDIRFVEHYWNEGYVLHSDLLAYVNDMQNAAPLDILIEDDTNVDFIAISYCLEADYKMGLTLSPRKLPEKDEDKFVFLSCREGVSGASCDPVNGDTSCERELPVACIRGVELPPIDVISAREELYSYWADGEISLTRPVSGRSFSDVSSVNAFCEEQLGEGWRLLNFHDGGGYNIVGHVVGEIPATQVWIDIFDQPTATCWTH